MRKGFQDTTLTDCDLGKEEEFRPLKGELKHDLQLEIKRYRPNWFTCFELNKPILKIGLQKSLMFERAATFEARTTSTNCSRITAADQFRKRNRPIVSCACPFNGGDLFASLTGLASGKAFSFHWRLERRGEAEEWNEECFVGNKASF